MIVRLRSGLSVLAMLALAACGQGDAAKGRGGPGGPGGPAPSVIAGPVRPMACADRIEAVGTAYARESTTIAATVTERIVRLNFTDGEYVRRGDVIAELARSEESAGLNEAQARLTEAQQQLSRLRQLQQRGFTTNARIDEQVAAVNSARAQAGAAQAQIGDRVIRAPFSGVVGLRRISPGATVTAGTEIATISDLSQIKLDFSLPETFLSAMRPGQAIEAKAAAYADELFRGTVDSIEATVDPVTRSVTVRAVLPNPDARLKPGMLLTVNVLANPRTALAVPELSVIAERDRSFVYKIDAESTALKTPIEIGARQEGMIEVRRGLAAGDRIVAEGTIKVRDGGKVRTAPQPAGSGRQAE